MIALVSHDAGGAEILSSWILKNPQPYCLVLDGPAIKIFIRKLGEVNNCHLEDVIEYCDWILCGTSWQSNLEKKAILQSKNLNKKIIAFIDHWTNYIERFQLDGKTVLPDEIWVGDSEAEKIAKYYFPQVKVLFQKNPYFAEIKKEFKKIQKTNSKIEKNTILYLCEPIREHALISYGDENYWNYTEEEALIYFLKNINVISSNVRKIEIRLHPSEKNNKYDWVKKYNLKITEISNNKSLIEQINGAEIVIGCESMSLVVALIAKKRVISSIPPKGKPCSLPQGKIEKLNELVLQYYKK